MPDPAPRTPYEAPRLVPCGNLLELTLGGTNLDTQDNGNQKRLAIIGST